MKLKNNKDTLTELITNESFQSWIAGSDDVNLNHKWEKWLDDNPKNKGLYTEVLRLWQAGKFINHPLPDVQQELTKLQEKLNLGDSNAEIEKSGAIIFPMKKRSLWKISAAVISAAAILLIIFYLNTNIFSHIFGEKYSTISTDFGERIKIDLADGSTVILNANSTLRYPSEFTSETKRNLYLNGEAYFIVAKRPHGDRLNFTVETDHGLITVIGTRFTVNTRTNQTKVSLISGRIKALAKTKSDNQKFSSNVIMNPGEFLCFEKDAQKLIPQNNIETLQISWWKEKLKLNKTSLKELIIRLKETYGIEVEIKDERLFKRTITGSIENKNLNLIIEAIGKVLQITVQIKGNTVIFEKSNV